MQRIVATHTIEGGGADAPSERRLAAIRQVIGQIITPTKTLDIAKNPVESFNVTVGIEAGLPIYA